MEQSEVVLGPLKTALSISLKSTHPWQAMIRLCTQLVDAFASQNLNLPDSDSHLRLKMAISYLHTSIRLVNMTYLLDNPITLTNEDSFSVAPSAELQKILASFFFSSVTAASTQPTLAANTSAAAPPAKGKAPAKGAAAAVAEPAAGSVNGRDAVLLLTSLLREVDPLWQEGSETDILADLHYLMKKHYPSYAAKCVLDKLPDASSPAVSIPVSSVFTFWTASSPPDGFAASLSQKGNCQGVDFYSNGGLFSHVTAFLLLGDKRDEAAIAAAAAAPAAAAAAAPPAKGAAKGEPPKPVAVAPVESSQPVLTKVILPRVDVMDIERQLRVVRDKYLIVLPKSVTLEIQDCNEKFADLMTSLLWLLQNGTAFAPGSQSNTPTTLGMKAKSKIVEKSASEFSLSISLPRSDKSIVLPISEKFMLNLANVLNPNMAVDALIDNDVCQLLRLSLGYI